MGVPMDVGDGSGACPLTVIINKTNKIPPGNNRAIERKYAANEYKTIKKTKILYSTSTAGLGRLREAKIFLMPCDIVRQIVVSLASSKSE